MSLGYFKGGGVDVPLFETLKTNAGTEKWVTGYRSELWYGSCFYDVYYGTAKKRRRKPPLAAEFFFPFLNEIDIFESFESILYIFL